VFILLTKARGCRCADKLTEEARITLKLGLSKSINPYTLISSDLREKCDHEHVKSNFTIYDD
jgi:hypothetical protein